MGTCIGKVVTATAAILVLALMLPASASAQKSADCNANLLLLGVTISRDELAARPGEIVNFTVNVINRSVIDAQIGCNALDVTADFFCPGPTGEADGASTNLFTNLDIPANDALAVFGPFPCAMPDIDPGMAFAGVVSTGNLNDSVTSPFLIEKTVAVDLL